MFKRFFAGKNQNKPSSENATSTDDSQVYDSQTGGFEVYDDDETPIEPAVIEEPPLSPKERVMRAIRAQQEINRRK